MVSVWCVEAGDYSDYHIIGVYSTEADAQRIAALCGAEVVERPLDPGIAELNQGLSPYFIIMAYDGCVEQVIQSHVEGALGEGLRVWSRTTAPFWEGRPVSDAVNGTVWARDAQHAIKIANEYRAQQIALGNMKVRE